ncbi:MAG: flagellar biosynthesis anti-sigma factor FlgM [Mariprofundales bacterium]|nr:flagellar biosynthesis anti-sigma factor FlgM [Mariprofundales bacterium]
MMVQINGLRQPATTLQSSKGGGSKATSGRGKTGRSSDRVKVADAASLHERAKVMLADMPDVRMERIEEIRDALEQGSFQMSEREVAVRIVRNALVERVWS